MSNTGHVLLISNKNNQPHIFLIQETNKHWGIFGGKEEEKDSKSLVNTAIRELHEESLGSLKGHKHLFSYLNHFSYKGMGKEGITNHQTFITVNSRIAESDISVDNPNQDQGFGDIKNGKFFPLSLVLETIFSGGSDFVFDSEKHRLRYLFAKAIKKNQGFLYPLFQAENLDAIEARHHLLNVHPVVSTPLAMVSSKIK